MIRSMQANDASIVYLIDQEDLKSNWTELLYKQELLDSNTYAYVYESNGEVVGFVMGRLSFETSELLQIAVRKEYRGQKVGYKLLNHLWNVCLKMSATEMVLEVNAKHTDIVNFYERVGFKELYRRKNYYGMRKDALVMRMKVNNNVDISN